MSEAIKNILSHDSGPFWQFVKYGAIGVMATGVQTAVFYLLASTCLKCLAPSDWAVRLLRLPPMGPQESSRVRAVRFAVATFIGFVLANIFCWLMNRWFVFTPGAFVWYVEFALFFAVSGASAALAIGFSSYAIRRFGLMTTIAVVVEVIVSFLVNFFVRKFVIFKG